MSQTKIEQYWRIVNKYEALIEGDSQRIIPPPPVDIRLDGVIENYLNQENYHVGVINESTSELINENSQRMKLKPIESANSSPRISFDQQQRELNQISISIESCANCSLCETRNIALAGEGVINPAVLVIDAFPSSADDELGQLLSGELGDYLEKWFTSIQLEQKKECYITSILKCVTPGNRNPLPDEVSACFNFLQAQVKMIQPKLIVTLGDIAFKSLSDFSFSDFTPDQWLSESFKWEGVPLIPLYHPRQVLDSIDLRRPVWEVLKQIKARLTHIRLSNAL